MAVRCGPDHRVGDWEKRVSWFGAEREDGCLIGGIRILGVSGAVEFRVELFTVGGAVGIGVGIEGIADDVGNEHSGAARGDFKLGPVGAAVG